MRKLLGVTVLFSTVSMQAWSACLPAAECARISDLEDFPLGTYSFSGGYNQNTSVCPYTQNDDEDGYMLTLTGSGAAGAFVIDNGVSEVAMDIYYRDDGGMWEAVTAGAATAYTGANQTHDDCSGGLLETGAINVRIPQSNLDHVTAGTYSGTITFSMTHD